MKITEVTINDYTPEVLNAMFTQVVNALETVGMVAEGYAQLLAPVDTGNLRNSITHEVDTEDHSVMIGSNVEYAPYVELGTGIYSEMGGRQTPWVYMDDNGEYHWTAGNAAQPFIKPAIDDHTDEWRSIIQNALKE